MDCWDILKLRPNSDEKAVKLAYSKLVKNIRPDEDPEGFQRLHSAYKDALKQAKTDAAKNRSEVSGINARPRTDQGLEDLSGESQANTRSSISAAAAATVNSHNKDNEYDDLIRKLQDLINQPENANKKKAWEELLNSSVLVDLQFRKRASDRLFCMVADARLNGSFPFNEKGGAVALAYLNEEFQWESNRSDLLFRFGRKRTEAVLNSLEKKKVEWLFWLVGSAGTIMMVVVIYMGYLGIPIIPVVLIAAVPGVFRRMYIRRWQNKRVGFNNGGDAEFLNGNVMGEYSLVYISVCIVEMLFYGVGWTLRLMVA